MGSHLIDGEFQSDKYPTTPRGCVPLKPSDPTAQDILWEYAQRRRAVDAEFADDLEEALRLKGFDPRGCGWDRRVRTHFLRLGLERLRLIADSGRTQGLRPECAEALLRELDRLKCACAAVDAQSKESFQSKRTQEDGGE